MKRTTILAIAVALTLGLASLSFAHGPWGGGYGSGGGWGHGHMMGGPGMMYGGQGMMYGGGPWWANPEGQSTPPCAQFYGPAQPGVQQEGQIDEETLKSRLEQYIQRVLPGYTLEKKAAE